MFEDLTGRVEALVLPDDLQEYRATLVPDAIIFLRGTVDKKREEPSLRVSQVIAVESAAEHLATALLLTVTEQTPLEELTTLLKANPGKSRVYMCIHTSNGLVAEVECARSLCVACTPLLVGQITTLLGAGAVRILGAGRRAIPMAPAEALPHHMDADPALAAVS